MRFPSLRCNFTFMTPNVFRKVFKNIENTIIPNAFGPTADAIHFTAAAIIPTSKKSKYDQLTETPTRSLFYVKGDGQCGPTCFLSVPLQVRSGLAMRERPQHSLLFLVSISKHYSTFRYLPLSTTWALCYHCDLKLFEAINIESLINMRVHLSLWNHDRTILGGFHLLESTLQVSLEKKDLLYLFFGELGNHSARLVHAIDLNDRRRNEAGRGIDTVTATITRQGRSQLSKAAAMLRSLILRSLLLKARKFEIVWWVVS